MTKIYLLTGPIHSRKTTRLQHWCSSHKNVGGLLSPVLHGKRVFHNLLTGEEKSMEAEPTETTVQPIGRYLFSGETFAWANEVLETAATNPKVQFLVVDEIGPLELQGKGLTPALQVILSNLRADLNLILVIREHLVAAVTGYFQLNRFPLHTFPPPETT